MQMHQKSFNKQWINSLTLVGRQYHLFDYFGHPNAKRIIILMGSGGETVYETVQHLQEKHDEEVGLIKVRLYRPFSGKDLLNAIPKSVEKLQL